MRFSTQNSRSLALLLLCQAVTTFGLMMLVPIMPLYIATLADQTQADVVRWSSVALAAPAVGTLLCAPFAGRFCDRYGYRRVLLVSLLLFVASMLLMASSTSLACFILGRILQGFSTIGVVLTAFIGHVSDVGKKGKSFGLQESAIAAGALLGPLAGGLILDYWSLRPMLFASAIATGAVGLILWSRLHEPAHTGRTIDDGNVVEHAFVFFRRTEIRNWMCAACLVQAAGFALLNAFALFMEAKYPALPALGSTIGLLHSLGWLATFLCGPLWGHLNDRGSARRHFAIAAFVCAFTVGLMMTAEQLWWIALLRIVQGACYAALMQSMLLACITLLPAELNGHVTGISRSFMVVGQLIGPFLIAAAVPFVAPLYLLWIVASLFFAAFLLIWRPAHFRLFSWHV
ncbi:MAG TPA: MFS transporter [Oxalicibacterium sp.]|uniref:MFS transporter n=1 Tax=Oxalicibacterium sp. TaxID=2766525 RepID=UPI002CDFB810|nr:MFS transporter [Oxalicibacterium sp.]HWU97128.1 MFS transporter [Oxalicibacterium sp.]